MTSGLARLSRVRAIDCEGGCHSVLTRERKEWLPPGARSAAGRKGIPGKRRFLPESGAAPLRERRHRCGRD